MSEELQNLLKQDPDFSESKFKSKVENEFVKIMLSMVTGKTDRIKHFVGDELYNSIEQKVQNDIANNRIQMYDELNVAGVDILKIEETENCFRIHVRVFSKALDYYLDRNTRKYLSGNNSSRTDRYTAMTFEKKKNTRALGVARQCPFCGANVDVNNNGVCVFCGGIFPLENYDWIITMMQAM